MNKDNTNPMIRADLLAAIIAAGTNPAEWGDRLRHALETYNESPPAPASIPAQQPAQEWSPASSPVRELKNHKPVILKHSKRYGGEKLFAIVECAGQEIKGNAWKQHGERLEQFNRGDRLELVIKTVQTKDGGSVINFEDPQSMVAMHEPQGGYGDGGNY